MDERSFPVLLAVAAQGLTGSLRRLPDRPLGDTQWNTMLMQARQQRLSGLLVDAIRGGGLPVTDRQGEEAVDAHISAMSHVLMLEDFLINAVEMFAKRGIDCRVLKGSAVAHLDYPDPTLRPFVDIDLLVRSEELDSAKAVLGESGFRRYYSEIRPGYDRRFGKGASFVSRDHLELDLHRTFAMGPFGLTVGLDDLWASGQEFTLAGGAMTALGPEERLLHACYHAALGDYPPRLLPHRDIAQMLLFGERDEATLMRLCRSWGGEAVVARAVRTTWELFDLADVTAVSAWATRHRPSAQDRRRIAVYTDGDTSYVAKSLASLGALPRVRDRVALLRMVASPDPSFLEGRHRSRAAWMLQGFRRAVRRTESDH